MPCLTSHRKRSISCLIFKESGLVNGVNSIIDIMLERRCIADNRYVVAPAGCEIVNMQIEIKLLIQLKQYLPEPDLAGNSRFLEIAKSATVKDVLEKLGIPLDMPKVIMINERQGAIDDALVPLDRLTIFPPVGGG
jgi:molybdopterin synthase sulfur carrier subunit